MASKSKIKIDLNGKLYPVIGSCNQCDGRGWWRYDGEGRIIDCELCKGTGETLGQGFTIAELFEAFREMLRHEGI